MAKPKPKQVPFSQVLAALQDSQQPFPAVYLVRFSDLSLADMTALKQVWGSVSADRRVGLLEDLEELSESDTVVSFDKLATFALDDSDPRVRTVATRLLWEFENVRLISKFLNAMEKDADEIVRAASATALGLYVLKMELEELPTDRQTEVEDRLLRVEQGQDSALVRRRALESLGFSSRGEVHDLILKAYRSDDKEWQASALFAMGRSADVFWERAILGSLNSPEPEVELEAVKAAGELELAAAREILMEKLENFAETDEEVRLAAAWSLSQIGGEGVGALLEKLIEEVEDDDDAEALELALDNLSFLNEMPGYGMFDPLQNIEDHVQIVDLTQPVKDDDEEPLSDELGPLAE